MYAMFEMDEKGILHAQMTKEVKKQQVASSILSSTFTAWKSDFPKVRHVIPVRRRDLIKVNELLTKNRIFVDAPEDYKFVLDYIRKRCPRVNKN